MTTVDRNPLRPLLQLDGYLPLEDYGLIGDGTTAALVGRDGRVAWMCVPRFDSDPLFCSLLDHGRGGSFVVSPEGDFEARQMYEPDSGILVTEMRSAGGTIRVTDFFAVRSGADLAEDVPAGRSELVRSIEVLSGEVGVRVEIEPRGGATAATHHGGLTISAARRPDLELRLDCSVPLEGLHSRVPLSQGQRLELILAWGEGATGRRRFRQAPDLLAATRDAWKRWSRCVRYEGPHETEVRRSAVTLKLLANLGTGGVIAAPTSSLPESIGGVRNWDYRYSWVRDAAFSVFAMRRVGLENEAWGFLAWVLDALERDGTPRVLYTLDGGAPPAERIDPDLEGYRGSSPVRWGNGAADQLQHDAYGEIMDAAYQWAARKGSLAGVWPRLVGVIEAAQERWNQPDQGIWEVRTTGRVFTYSAAMCHVALERGARLVDMFGLSGDAAGWRADTDRIAAAILEEAWDDQRKSLTESFGGGGGIDASLLALPLRRVIPAKHPKMVATVEGVVRELGAGDGLVYRYIPKESPDGLPGHEGAFLLCSFWLVDNLVYQGRLDEAVELYDSLCSRTSPLGLLPEEIDPSTGAFLGNFPQAFSHVGLISSAINLSRSLSEVSDA